MDPPTGPPLYTNKPDIPCSMCGELLQKPPNTGPEAIPVCIMCDRKPRGRW